MFVVTKNYNFVCLFVCLSVCQQNYSHETWWRNGTRAKVKSIKFWTGSRIFFSHFLLHYEMHLALAEVCALSALLVVLFDILAFIHLCRQLTTTTTCLSDVAHDITVLGKCTQED